MHEIAMAILTLVRQSNVTLPGIEVATVSRPASQAAPTTISVPITTESNMYNRRNKSEHNRSNSRVEYTYNTVTKDCPGRTSLKCIACSLSTRCCCVATEGMATAACLPIHIKAPFLHSLLLPPLTTEPHDHFHRE